MTRTRSVGVMAPFLVGLILASCRPAGAEAVSDYLVLGDSYAFGTQTVPPGSSNGDQGYAKLYGDYLATQNGGVRPQVVNLAVFGESTSSFFDPTNPGFGRDPFANTNYTGQPATITQNDLFLSTVQSELAMGHAINTVSIQIGGDDFLGYLDQNPGFFNLSQADQQAIIKAMLGTVQTNLGTILTELRQLLPTANLLVLGYPNVYGALTGTPISEFAAPVTLALNDIIRGEALHFGGSYVDLYMPFLGHEADYTHILDPPAGTNNHPNDTGYAVIAQQMELASVPEPGSLVLEGLGAAGLLTFGWCRRRRTAA